jgi:hypothetical protein
MPAVPQPGHESDADPHAQAEGNGGSVQPAEISDDLWAGVAPDVEADTEADAHANAEVAAEIMAHDLTTMLDEYGLDEYGMEPGGDDPEFPGAHHGRLPGEPGVEPRSLGKPGNPTRADKSASTG